MAFLIFNLHCRVVERKLENIFAIVLEKKFLDCAYITRSSITTIFHYKNNVKSLRTVFFGNISLCSSQHLVLAFTGRS